MSGGFVLTFTVAGEQQLERGFSRFAEDVKDLSPAFEQIADDFKQIEKKQFDSEGSYGSGGWKPLSSSYAKWKSKYHPGKKILVLSGLMKESLEDDNPYTIRDIQPMTLTLGTTINYAIYHQKGTPKMSARPPIQLNEADKTRWTKIIQKYLVNEANKAFAGLMPDITRGQKAVGSI